MGAEVQLDSDLVLARLFPRWWCLWWFYCEDQEGWGRGQARMLSGFWRVNILGRETEMAILFGDRMTQMTGYPSGAGGGCPGWIRGSAAQGRLWGHRGAYSALFLMLPCSSLPGGTQHKALSCRRCPAHPPERHPV